MNNQSDRVPEFFEGNGDNNLLWEYVQSLSPETVSHLSKPTSADVFQVMERNVMGLLGNIPSDHFDVTFNRKEAPAISVPRLAARGIAVRMYRHKYSLQ